MYVTVSIDDKVYEQIRRIAFESCRTLEDVINELLSEGLKLSSKPPERRQLGQLRDTIIIADDYDDTPSEVLNSLNDPI